MSFLYDYIMCVRVNEISTVYRIKTVIDCMVLSSFYFSFLFEFVLLFKGLHFINKSNKILIITLIEKG